MEENLVKNDFFLLLEITIDFFSEKALFGFLNELFYNLGKCMVNISFQEKQSELLGSIRVINIFKALEKLDASTFTKQISKRKEIPGKMFDFHTLETCLEKGYLNKRKVEEHTEFVQGLYKVFSDKKEIAKSEYPFNFDEKTIFIFHFHFSPGSFTFIEEDLIEKTQDSKVFKEYFNFFRNYMFLCTLSVLLNTFYLLVLSSEDGCYKERSKQIVEKINYILNNEIIFGKSKKDDLISRFKEDVHKTLKSETELDNTILNYFFEKPVFWDPNTRTYDERKKYLISISQIISCLNFLLKEKSDDFFILFAENLKPAKSTSHLSAQILKTKKEIFNLLDSLFHSPLRDKFYFLRYKDYAEVEVLPLSLEEINLINSSAISFFKGIQREIVNIGNIVFNCNIGNKSKSNLPKFDKFKIKEVDISTKSVELDDFEVEDFNEKIIDHFNLFIIIDRYLNQQKDNFLNIKKNKIKYEQKLEAIKKKFVL